MTDQPSTGEPVVTQAEQWLRAISDWLLANDHDMTLPKGVLDTDPLDIADELARHREQADTLARQRARDDLVEEGYTPGYEFFRNKWIGDQEEMIADMVRCFVPRTTPTQAQQTGDKT